MCRSYALLRGCARSRAPARVKRGQADLLQKSFELFKRRRITRASRRGHRATCSGR